MIAMCNVRLVLGNCDHVSCDVHVISLASCYHVHCVIDSVNRCSLHVLKAS